MPEEHRLKIKTSNILNRLSKLVSGELSPDEMPAHVVTAALGLLRKALPDLASQDVTINQQQPFAVLPPVIEQPSEWEDAFKPKH